MASVDRGVPPDPEGLNDLGPTGSGSSCSGCTRLTVEVAVLQGIQDILEAWAAQGKLETLEPEAV